MTIKQVLSATKAAGEDDGFTVDGREVNQVRVVGNILRQDKVALTHDELRLYGMVFQRHDLEVEEFQALLKIGEWKTLQDKEELTRAGERVEKVSVVVRGNVVAHARDGDVALGEGKYVGEVSLLKVYASVCLLYTSPSPRD